MQVGAPVPVTGRTLGCGRDLHYYQVITYLYNPPALILLLTILAGWNKMRE
jgi:hypothetical protein